MLALETSNAAATARLASIPSHFTIRGARTAECQALGELIVEVYSRLPGEPC